MIGMNSRDERMNFFDMLDKMRLEDRILFGGIKNAFGLVDRNTYLEMTKAEIKPFLVYETRDLIPSRVLTSREVLENAFLEEATDGELAEGIREACWQMDCCVQENDKKKLDDLCAFFQRERRKKDEEKKD